MARVPGGVTVVVPTVGRPSLGVLLTALADAEGPPVDEVVVVDDRRSARRRAMSAASARATPDLDLGPSAGRLPVRVVRTDGGGRGPAAARNAGWRTASTAWVAFLDDDVVPAGDWPARLADDLRSLPEDVAGSQGRIEVPLPVHRRPTDAERGTAGLAGAAWITADMAYRRTALAAVGGFDERFRRAYREDSDLALRVLDTGRRLVRGNRLTRHPVRRADDWASVRAQAGNSDDVLMRRLHGRTWRARAQAGRGRWPRHAATVTSGLLALLAVATGRRRAAGLLALGWLGGTAELAVARIRPGPRDPAEVRRMLLTSAVIPAAACWYRLGGLVRHTSLPGAPVPPWRGLPDLVLFDRDGTLVHDVPYNGDPGRVRPVSGALQTLDRLRAGGVRVGVLTNQSGVARGLLSPDDVRAVNARVEDELGPFDVWQVCQHGPDDGCGCRKPAPGMVQAACERLNVDPSRCVVVGDIGADVAAARAAGATGVLVPTPVTRRSEVRSAPHRVGTLAAAVDLVLGGVW